MNFENAILLTLMSIFFVAIILCLLAFIISSLGFTKFCFSSRIFSMNAERDNVGKTHKKSKKKNRKKKKR